MATGGQAESWSEEYIEYPCSVCEEDKKLSDSGHYCLSCKVFLCLDCLSGHKKYTTGHQVITLTAKTFQTVLTERCVDHPDEVIEHYCGTHDVLLCNTCERLGHRSCKNVKQINEAANELIADQKLQAVPDLLQSTLGRVTQVMDTIDNYVDNVQKRGHAYIKDLENYERTLIAKIRELTAKGRNRITDAKNQLISAANDRRKDCAKTKELMSKNLEDVKRSQKRTTHLVILKKKGQGLVNRADYLCKEFEDSIKNRPFFYEPDTQIIESLNGFSSLVTEIEQYTIGHRSDTNIKISDDKQNSDIYGCGWLGDGTLVVSDYGNTRLKRVDPSTNKVTDHFTMKDEPVGLCCIGPQEVAEPGVHQSGVTNPAANSGMFANALRGPSLQYGNFRLPSSSLPMPIPGFFSQPSPVVQPAAVQAQSGLFPSPGQMGAKPGINPAPQSKPVTATMPQASAGKSTPIMPPNDVASQSMESKPKLIASSVGITTPKKDQEVVQLMLNAGGLLAAQGQVSPGSAAAMLRQLAAKHQESSKSPVAPAANTITTTPQKTVFGGFTFTSTTKITDPKKSEAAQPTSTATFTPKPFSGVSLSAPMSKTASTGPGAFTVSPSVRKQNLSTCSDDHIDEYEPNIDFKPVVPLPQLIEVKTGEEDEDRMFCERAKLFRFDQETKQWKERGLGEMKILKHKQTKVVRILMRREQVLKLCANHRLTKEIKLMPMTSLDKAWVWEAMDFSEEEMKYIRLACKFKTADIASKFKEAFEACQKEMSSDLTGQVKKVDLSTMFKSKPGFWFCDGCFIKNNAEILKCPCCKTLKPGVKKEDVKPASTLSVQPTFGSSAKPAGTAFTFGGTSSSTGAFKFGTPAAGLLPGSEQGKVPIFGCQPGAAYSSGKGFTFTPSTLAAATTAGNTSTGFKFASRYATTSSSIFGATTTTTASSSSGGFVFGSPAAGSGAFQFGTTQGVSEARRRCAGGVETIEVAGKSPTKAAADNDDDGDDDDDDVIFVKEEKASAIEILTAREFMLPDNFYLYLKCKPCPGCRGCEDRMPEDDAPRSSGSKGRDKPTFVLAVAKTTVQKHQNEHLRPVYRRK